jgi:RNA polymerase sigma factor (sigma-70 family)
MADYDHFALRIAQGDTQAFATWMRHCEGQLRASLLRYARLVDTEAVLQEALLRLWQVAREFESDQKPNGFLRLGIRIARNLAIDVLRKRREILDEGTQSSEEHLVQGEGDWAFPDPLLRTTLQVCYDALPPSPQKIFGIRTSSQGAESDEVLAQLEGMRLNTFLQNFTRARKLLVECLEKKGINAVAFKELVR